MYPERLVADEGTTMEGTPALAAAWTVPAPPWWISPPSPLAGHGRVSLIPGPGVPSCDGPGTYKASPPGRDEGVQAASAGCSRGLFPRRLPGVTGLHGAEARVDESPRCP